MHEQQLAPNPPEMAAPQERPADRALDAHPSLVERPLRTLKSGDVFAVLDSHGDIGVTPDTSEGLFSNDTRHLSRLQLFFEAKRPLLLGSVIQDDNTALTVDLANPEIMRKDGSTLIPRDAIAIERTKFLWNSVCYERVGLRNFDRVTHEFTLSLSFEADFRDLFEVRGMKRARRGDTEAHVSAGRRASLIAGSTIESDERSYASSPNRANWTVVSPHSDFASSQANEPRCLSVSLAI